MRFKYCVNKICRGIGQDKRHKINSNVASIARHRHVAIQDAYRLMNTSDIDEHTRKYIFYIIHSLSNNHDVETVLRFASKGGDEQANEELKQVLRFFGINAAKFKIAMPNTTNASIPNNKELCPLIHKPSMLL